MNALIEAAKQLESEAARLRETAAKLTDLVQPGDLPAAVADLDGMGLKEWTLEMSLTRYSHRDTPSLRWSAWDGSKHHEGKTLGACLAAVAKAHAPAELEPADPIACAESALCGPAPF